jgi:hypothetical protein
VFLFDSIPDALFGMAGYSKSFAGVYEFGTFDGILVGDISWVEDSSIIFVRGNIGARVQHTGNLQLVEFLSRKMLEKIDQNLDQDTMETEQRLKEHRISKTVYETILQDCIPAGRISDFSQQIISDSKWLLPGVSSVMGWRTEYVDDAGNVIGIDVASGPTGSDAFVMAETRLSYIPTSPAHDDSSWVLTTTDEASLDSLIMHLRNRQNYTTISKNIISGIVNENKYVAHVYCYAPSEVDIDLFRSVVLIISNNLSF